ncbi:hypothetical protein Taro_022675 [Colocasia esculenta]|uniref:Uncharacterized protein n=1 Tax=Colocasia esculenta TaxID=4460 RepID=A0A843UV35_COLES|nr:hypothetical protein [Colocasia esculenta]
MIPSHLASSCLGFGGFLCLGGEAEGAGAGNHGFLFPELAGVAAIPAARERESYGQRDGVKTYERLLGQVHHRYPRQQVELQ